METLTQHVLFEQNSAAYSATVVPFSAAFLDPNNCSYWRLQKLVLSILQSFHVKLRAGDRPESLLTSCVPDLELDCPVNGFKHFPSTLSAVVRFIQHIHSDLQISLLQAKQLLVDWNSLESEINSNCGDVA